MVSDDHVLMFLVLVELLEQRFALVQIEVNSGFSVARRSLVICELLE